MKSKSNTNSTQIATMKKSRSFVSHSSL